jgi:hypothetical protein
LFARVTTSNPALASAAALSGRARKVYSLLCGSPVVASGHSRLPIARSALLSAFETPVNGAETPSLVIAVSTGPARRMSPVRTSVAGR